VDFAVTGATDQENALLHLLATEATTYSLASVQGARDEVMTGKHRLTPTEFTKSGLATHSRFNGVSGSKNAINACHPLYDTNNALILLVIAQALG
jgi:hypothetical protein